MNFDHVKNLTVGGRSAVRLEIGGSVVWRGLPAGYMELDYIRTTGTQYIDTEFIPNQDSRIVCEFLRTGGNGVYGARYSTASGNFCLRGISSKWQPGYNATLGTTDIALDEQWHIADQNKNIFSLDGVVAKEFTYEEFTAPKSIILGGINANNAVYYGQGCYRSCRIYDNGVLVRDMIPCMDPDGSIGMFDTRNAVFYGNAGTGTFTAGAEV